MVKPKKHLGQHFLNNPFIAQKIVDYFISLSKYFSIEIGAGTGVLTEKLIQHFNLDEFIAIDIDKESIDYLIKKFPDHQHQFLLEDFLSSVIIQDILSSRKVNIIGNFPYNISSQIMFKVLEYKNNVENVVGMFQKEVAQRICSPPGNKDYGILSVLLQTYYYTEYLFTVKEGSFTPPPKVQSAVISLKRKYQIENILNEKLFFEIVKLSFQQRRKTLRNSLSKFRDFLLYADKRPEQLSFIQFIEIANKIEENLNFKNLI